MVCLPLRGGIQPHATERPQGRISPSFSSTSLLSIVAAYPSECSSCADSGQKPKPKVVRYRVLRKGGVWVSKILPGPLCCLPCAFLLLLHQLTVDTHDIIPPSFNHRCRTEIPPVGLRPRDRQAIAMFSDGGMTRESYHCAS